MKKRSLPFGYCLTNGVVSINAHEADTLHWIAHAYLSGQSLLEIASQLNASQVEYMPGVISWNKARLKRILEDEKHLGNDQYPSILDMDTHSAIMNLKESKNTQKDTDRKSEIFKLGVPVICPFCGSEMHRRQDVRSPCPQRWVCRNKECGKIIAISDVELLAAVTSLMNLIILNPETIKTENTEMVFSAKVLRMENEISRTLECNIVSKDTLREKMLQCVSAKFDEINSVPLISELLRTEFERMNPLDEFSSDLFNRTVRNIHLGSDGSVGITLINDQRIGWR